MEPVGDLAVKGYGNTSTTITHQGTIQWKIQDDQGTALTLVNLSHSTFPFCQTGCCLPTHGSANERPLAPRDTYGVQHMIMPFAYNVKPLQHTKIVQLENHSMYHLCGQYRDTEHTTNSVQE
jgi:hypothetical protein